MTRNEIKKIRSEVGKYLHDYYINNGEEKYEKLVKSLSNELKDEYGNLFDDKSLRIMEAEYITFNRVLRGKHKSQDTKNTSSK